MIWPRTTWKASAQAFFLWRCSPQPGSWETLIGGVVFDAIGAKLFYFSVFCLYLISIAIFAGSFSDPPQSAKGKRGCRNV